ncbi:uncharacterized protein MONBRDRAFT_33173 [Monosiga brevicollis MX1]|uniref:DJ-1/PfpI domain-containing protein n=1 Tax=Monosiga brevicollis TaxID=81824 RepID=A9V3H5_MONBE|nr:uncharacterized protein MONBRDRAFT_33173 [Monosiga brevicollis MX1]EDQ87913.1 predicted protein [Monosiga brevicollis MX1]|eukprot:XP_001747446.1 hypothetical protein [Monosiga brevicollis MX1]
MARVVASAGARALSTQSGLAAPRVALVLSGSGVYDGTEVHEASAAMGALSRQGADYKIFAPDKQQHHVVNHMTGEEMDESRNVLVEAARIARGNIQALDKLQVADFDAVVVPGGFGAAKNLSNFAVEGAACTVDATLTDILKKFHAEQKPMGFCCIAPVIAANLFKGEVTMGSDTESDKWPFAGAAGACKEMGADYVVGDESKVHVDQANRIVTAPAFMANTAVHLVQDNVTNMVQTVLELVGRK